MATKVTGWFPHDIESTDDIKMQRLIDQYGAEGYGIWWRVVEVLHKHGGSIDLHSLYFLVDRSLGVGIKYDQDSEDNTCCESSYFVIKDMARFGLLNETDDVITSDRVMRNLEYRQDVSAKRSEAGRRGGKASPKQVPSKSKANAKQVPSKDKAKTSTLTVTYTDTVTKKKNTPLPPETGGVLDYPEFLQAWSDWYQHRSELRKPNTRKAAEKQLARLAEIKQSGGDPVTVINNAIEKGWQGLYGSAKPTRAQMEEYVSDKWPADEWGNQPQAKHANVWYLRQTAAGWKNVDNWKASLTLYIEQNEGKL